MIEAAAIGALARAGGGAPAIALMGIAILLVLLLLARMSARHERIEEAVDRIVRENAKSAFRQKYPSVQAAVHVIIPAYNEAQTIGAVLERIPDEIFGLRTRPIVVVDGAEDETAAVVENLGYPAVVYAANRGGGSALKAGYELAAEGGASIVVTLDADGQHDPGEIATLVAPILDREADLVNGSRVLGSYERDGHLRATGVVLFNWLVSALTGTRITDCSNGFRAIRASILGELDLRQRQFHAPELLIEALGKGYRVKEVPVTVRRRRIGASKKGPGLQYATGFMRAILGTWLR